MKSSFACKTVLLFSIVLLAVSGIQAQETRAQKNADKAALIKTWIDARTYVFVAQSALPMSGSIRQLTSEYNVVVTPDSVVSYLPYFGRAYSAPVGATRSPLDFKTKNFAYTATPRKKGGWDVSIKPKDMQDVQGITLTVSPDGYATAQVTSNNRQPISFNGYVDQLKTRKKK